MNQRGFVFAPMLLQALPYIIGVALFAGAVWWVYHKGYESGASTVQAKWNQAVIEQRQREAKQIESASAKLEEGNGKAKVIYRTIVKTVDRVVAKPSYAAACFDRDGLSVANAALLGTLPVAAESDNRMPSADAARGRKRGLSPSETR